MPDKAIKDFSRAIQVNPNPPPDGRAPVLGSPWQYRYRSYAGRAEAYTLDGKYSAGSVDAQKAVSFGYPKSAMDLKIKQAKKNRKVVQRNGHKR